MFGFGSHRVNHQFSTHIPQNDAMGREYLPYTVKVNDDGCYLPELKGEDLAT